MHRYFFSITLLLLILFQNRIAAAQFEPLSLSQWAAAAVSGWGAHPASTLLAEETAGKKNDPNIQYHIDCQYMPETKSIRGTIHLRWRHPGELPIEALPFHFYQNAFQPSSTFMLESGGSHRGAKAAANQPGSIDVQRIYSHTHQSDLTSQLVYYQPDDKNSKDKTLGKVPLPYPLLPGESIHLEVQFTTQLPAVFARSGTSGEFIMAGQWYPKIAAYERKGQRGRIKEGFNEHQYHGDSEFFADFASYDVSIATPANYHVGATGRLAHFEQGSQNKYRFVQQRVHDFAWSADSRFQIVKRVVNLPDNRSVELQLFLQPEHMHQAQRQLEAVSNALVFLTKTYGPYPYTTLTIIDPPHHAMGAGGMEYPTLITGGSSLLTAKDSGDPERVLIHETAHQYWYGLVATNEFESPWLDEGLTTYSENRIFQEYYPPARPWAKLWNLPLAPLPLVQSVPESLRIGLQPWMPDPISLPAWKFDSSRSYGLSVYYRAALMLYSLENRLGREQMDKILSTYCRNWSLGHPGEQDFLWIVGQIGGAEARKFVRQALNVTGQVDYAVGRVQQKNTSAGPVWEVRIDRLGEAVEPVPISITRSDGQRTDVTWDGQDRYHQIILPGDTPISKVAIDPAGYNLLDLNRLNNIYTSEQDSLTILRWTVLTMNLYQNLLALFL